MRVYWIKAQAPRRVLSLIKYLGVEAELVEMDLACGEMSTPDYASLNPNMKAPTLVDEDLVLWEASAIMAYLSIRAGSNVWPVSDLGEQVEVLRWLSWNDCHWAPAVSPFYFEHVVKATFGFGPPDRESLKLKVSDLLRYARVLDGHLEGRTYAACDRLTIADFQLASMATDWVRSEMPLEAFPNIVRWIETLMKIPAWANPWPATKTDSSDRAFRLNNDVQHPLAEVDTAAQDYGSFYRAAHALDVDQPTLSRAVLKIDLSIVVRIFERSRRCHANLRGQRIPSWRNANDHDGG